MKFLLLKSCKLISFRNAAKKDFSHLIDYKKLMLVFDYETQNKTLYENKYRYRTLSDYYKRLILHL